MALQQCTVTVYRPAMFGLARRRVAAPSVGIDLSETGLQFAISERVPPGQTVHVEAKLPAFQDEVMGEARVVWCTSNQRVAGEYLVGIEWTSLSEGHFTKIQHIRKVYRSREFQQKLKTRDRVRRETPDDSMGLEYKTFDF